MNSWNALCVLAIIAFVLASMSSAGDEEGKKKEKKPVTKLQIGVKKRVEDCKVRSRKGDSLQMHYTVSKLEIMISANLF